MKKIRTTPPLLNRDGPEGDQLVYLDHSIEAAVARAESKRIGDGGALGFCEVIDPSTGRIIGLKVTSVLANGDTVCEVVPVCTGPNCNDVWYCTDRGAVKQQPGPRPADYVSGPYTTEDLAHIYCPVPPLIFRDCCNGSPISAPGRISLSFTNKTGIFAGRLPNSIVIIPTVPYIPYPGFGGPPWGGRYSQFGIRNSDGSFCEYGGVVEIYAACRPNGWAVYLSVGFNICCNAIAPHSTDDRAPWTGDTLYAASWTRQFLCGENWLLDAPESLGTSRHTFQSTTQNGCGPGGSGVQAGTFDLVLSR